MGAPRPSRDATSMTWADRSPGQRRCTAPSGAAPTGGATRRSPARSRADQRPRRRQPRRVEPAVSTVRCRGYQGEPKLEAAPAGSVSRYGPAMTPANSASLAGLLVIAALGLAQIVAPQDSRTVVLVQGVVVAVVGLAIATEAFGLVTATTRNATRRGASRGWRSRSLLRVGGLLMVLVGVGMVALTISV